ncbi:hypothetical protein C1645_732212 [Glomus cerebriforme]|uniref:Uncharacterized protein n=1 Tax=Glomus cerebriforme TaxID=658196 RepID=A0A397THD0_9GLOM|nr:hypothetical protein C1645_732212 [Glomus cerebriforme]
MFLLFSFVGLSVFSLILKSGKRFSELFGLDWKGKMIFCAFSLILESETVLFTFRLVREIGNDSPSVQTLGIRKWIRFFSISAWKSGKFQSCNFKTFFSEYSALGIQDWKHSAMRN